MENILGFTFTNLLEICESCKSFSCKVF